MRQYLTPLLLLDAAVSLFYANAAGDPLDANPLWFGAQAHQLVLTGSYETTQMAATGAANPRMYQGNEQFAVSMDKVWALQNSVLRTFRPERNQRFVLQIAWHDKRLNRGVQRIYYGVMFNGDTLSSQGTGSFISNVNVTAERMTEADC